MRRSVDSDAPIRVLFVEQAIAFGGAFVVIAELIRRLRRDRVRASLVTAMDPGFVADRLGMTVPVEPLHHTVDYARITRLTQWLTKLGLPQRLAGYLVTGLAAFLNIGYSVRLASVVLRRRVNVIHVNNGTEHMESNVALFAFARRCVVHVHGAERPARLQRILMNRAARIVAISDTVRVELERGGVDPARIVVVPNPITLSDPDQEGASAARARVRRRHSVPDDALVFGIFGRLVRWKGHREFLLAAADVIRSLPNAHAMIVGGSSDLDPGQQTELRRLARELRIEDRVVFTGFVSDVASHYRAVDVVVHSSIEPEPFGLVIVEAMACGIPVIAADRGAPLEIITHGVDGLLVEPERVDLLASAIKDLLKDGERRTLLADHAREVVLRRYDPDRFARRMEAIYLQVGRSPQDASVPGSPRRNRTRSTALFLMVGGQPQDGTTPIVAGGASTNCPR